MNRIIKSLLLSLSITSATPAQHVAVPYPKDAATAAVDSLFSGYDLSGTSGISVMVIRDGKIIYNHSFGLADVAHKVPATSRTNYRIASVTKSFTAMAVMMLQEAGKLSLDDPLTKFFPEFPAYGRQITVRHMLTHTSGLLDYGDLVPPEMPRPLTDRDVVRLVAQQDSTFFPPGEKFQYSNTAYVMLGLIVENVSGMPFRDFMKRRIFEPLGMRHTMMNSMKDSIPNKAYGYTLKDGRLVEKDQSRYSYLLGDGGIYTSVEDFYKWDQALYTGKLVKPETMKEIFTKRSRQDLYFYYGYGWYLDEQNGAQRVSHTGGTSGFSSNVIRYPEKKFSILLFANQNDGVDLGKIGEAIERIYLGRP